MHVEAVPVVGRLPETLLHQSRLMDQSLALRDDMLAEWLPRMVYCPEV
ncbi:hypothetical protein J2T60_001836 [Natronospira proteinivora]|uniref:Uncharacterized protein n=1 Tax=Natronospira proteinivora TaxID=1807133 RepID=A0ABT1G943_9GAMM|nr:hypothetical protein [Natronospira proteinivora]MCP1727836.1 hypothetical protein [Natronospira proteinivora]